MVLTLRPALVTAVSALAFFAFSSVAAASSLSIQQISTTDLKGTWTLAGPEDRIDTGNMEQSTLDDLREGTYTLLVKQPKGATVRITLLQDELELNSVDTPQMTFQVGPEQNLRALVVYSFNLIGTVGVTSDPPGVDFTVTGPNAYKEELVTPWSWESAPMGQYTVTFHPPKGCAETRTQSQLLQRVDRVAFTLTLDCPAADAMRAEQAKQTEVEQRHRTEDTMAHLSASNFVDVADTDWFASYVWRVNQRELMTGYRDASGTPTGKFGPQNPVTLAELVAIARRAAERPDNPDAQPKNRRARDQWFSQTWAAAELDSFVVTFDSDRDPNSSATRSEVLQTLLQAYDIPVFWPRGEIFADVSARLSGAAAIETGARLGLISSERTDDKLPSFRPNDPVNRAELSKILSILVQLHEQEQAGE